MPLLPPVINAILPFNFCAVVFIPCVFDCTKLEVLANPRNQKAEVQALQDTIYVIGGKRKLPIINSICNGNKRFREIERSIPGITTRMLSRELKESGKGGLLRLLPPVI
jgi:hypothetical protein